MRAGALNAGTRTGTIQLAVDTRAARSAGTIRALVITGSAQSAGYSTAVAGGATTSRVDGCVDFAYVLPTSLDEFHTRNAGHPILLGSGRRLIIGGFNTEGLAGWGGAYVTNEVWASDDDGASYLLLAHDPNPPTSGAGARFPPMHSVASGSCQGRAVVCGDRRSLRRPRARRRVGQRHHRHGVDSRQQLGAMGNEPRGQPRRHRRRHLLHGGQTDTLNAATANSHVYKVERPRRNVDATRGRAVDLGTVCLWQPLRRSTAKSMSSVGDVRQHDPVVYDGVYAFNGTWRERCSRKATASGQGSLFYRW